MKNVLNITNGDCAVAIMKKAGVPGAFLPWRDVLHDGPVPGHLSLERLSKIRAQYIIDLGWGEPAKIKRDFIGRDNTLKSFDTFEKVILWFEHDLYDQLQLLQILDWFHQKRKKIISLSMICVNQYLGMLSKDEIISLYQYEEPITSNHLELSNRAWTAFRADTPDDWLSLLEVDTSLLPFLEAAIIRMSEEYPDCSDGLSRTARHALEIVLQGEKDPGNVFKRYQETEERRFMGDAGFWMILHRLLESSPPLLKLPPGKKLTLPAGSDQELTVSQAGKDVLSGKRNGSQIVDLNRWIGGVHLSHDNVWFWDSSSGDLIKKT